MIVVREYSATPVAGVLARMDLGESPLWDPDAGLRWVDIEQCRMFTLDERGQISNIPLSTTVTAVELGSQDFLLAVTSTGFAWLDPDTGDVDPIVDLVDGDTVTMNDGAVDSRGRAWAGSAARGPCQRGTLYRLERKHTSSHVHGIGMSNGIDWSPDGDVLYHVDTTAGTVTAWDYDADRGDLGPATVLKRVSADVGLPDGLTVDSAGNIWLAIWGAGQVWCLDADTGEKIAIVHVPSKYPTSCVFGGPRLSTLYITTAAFQQAEGDGLVYAVAVSVTGRSPNRFAGVSP